MDLDRLRVFQAICEEGSVTRAAVRLFRTQPAVSMQLRALEAEAGARLFERTRRGVRPTPEGQRLLACCAELFRAHDRLREAWRAAEGEGELTIACSDPVSRFFLPQVLVRLVAAHPRTRLHVLPSATPEALNRLRRGEADVAFVLRPAVDPRLSLETVLRYRHVAAFPSGSRRTSTSRRPIEPRELGERHLILLHRGTQTRRLIDDAFLAKGIVPGSVLDVGSVSLQKELVRRGLGVAILPGYAVEPRDGLAVRPIAGASVREIAMAWRKDLPPTRALEAFLAFARTRAANG